MTKFKVGDKVKVREELVVGNEYDGGCAFVDFMNEYKGKVSVVVSVGKSVEGYDRYRLEGNRWIWTNEMLEKAKGLDWQKLFKSL